MRRMCRKFVLLLAIRLANIACRLSAFARAIEYDEIGCIAGTPAKADTITRESLIRTAAEYAGYAELAESLIAADQPAMLVVRMFGSASERIH